MIYRPYKHMELEVLETNKTTVKFRIKEQTHRGDKFSTEEFSFNPRCYYAFQIDGINMQLRSSYGPQVTDRVFYVRGEGNKCDNSILKTNKRQFAKISKLVECYNIAFSSPDLNVGDKIYHKTKRGNILKESFNPEKQYNLFSSNLEDFIQGDL